MRYLTFALAKGRLAKTAMKMFEDIGIECEEMKDEKTRKLIFVNEELKLKFFLSKASDVPTYVEYGAADIGIVGADTILEEGRKLYEVLDLGFGKCNILYAYSLLCFASGLGQDGFFLLPVLFALRLMLVLPCTLLLGSAAWETSRGLAALSVGGGKRAKGVTYGKRYWSRFGIACVCLFFGAALELWFIPRILSLLLR